MKAINIKTEYLTNPLGIDISEPRVFWNCDSGLKQTAYQIISDDWDSGKVETESMNCVMPFKFTERRRIEFRIRLWDENDCVGEWSEPAFFEFGIKRWDAQWITGNYMADDSRYRKMQKIGKSFFLQGVDLLKTSKKADAIKRYPVDCFRKNFEVKEDVKNARLYITACGLYEASLDGKRIGDFILAPGITDYRKRIQYQTYDVTSMLAPGENEITVDLADGWYRGATGAWGLKQEYGYETKFIAQLEIDYADGSSEKLITDASWDWSDDGPIRFADNKDGETVDAGRKPSYSGKAKPATCNVIPTASNNVFIKEHEHFKPTVITTPSNKTVLDFGQNMAGYIEFRMKAKAGNKVKLRFGEMLDEACEFTQKNATVWSTKSNSSDIPTDCPTRERHGWTGDAQIFFGTASYLFDYAAFARKFLNDVYDWQKADGKLPQIAPPGGIDFYMDMMNGSTGWADMLLLFRKNTEKVI